MVAKTIEIEQDLYLELVNEIHTNELFSLIEKNKMHLCEWLPWVDNMSSVEFIENFIKYAKHSNEARKEFAYVIIQDKKIIGRIGLYKIDNKNKIAEIGYWITFEKEGKGLISKSCKKLIEYAFNEIELNRIEIKCGVKNKRSQHIPERLGFTNEGILREAELIRDHYIDLYLYSLLRSELPIL